MANQSFFERKGFKPSFKLYFIDAMGAMAQGLFATLLMGTILKTIGERIPGCSFLTEIAAFAQNGYVVGGAIGVAIAYALGAKGLVLFTSILCGAVGYAFGDVITLADGSQISYTAGPAGAFVAVLVSVEIGKLVYKSTKVDILVTPLTVTLVGFGISKLCCPAIAYAMYWLGNFVNTATEMQPFFMGIIVSVVVGVALTLPISSAAICAMIGIAGIAGGAATAGCCAQMVGFAVMSYKENGIGGLVAQGLGTSMLQMGNIIRHPIIWIPPTLAAAITGPVSTMVFKLECNGLSAGMGTCGIVGPLGIISAMGDMTAMDWLGIVSVCVVLPALLTLLISAPMRKLKWIKEDYLKLDL